MYGKRPFETDDESRNNWAVALVSLGEGWHHSHHAFPTSARHGLQRRQFDPSYALIKLFARLGWAWDVKEPKPEQVEAKRVDNVPAEPAAEPQPRPRPRSASSWAPATAPSAGSIRTRTPRTAGRSRVASRRDGARRAHRPLPARRGRGPDDAGARPRRAVSDPARDRRQPRRLRARRARRRARPGARPLHLPAAAAVQRGVLLLAARPAQEPAPDHAQRDRARAPDHGRRGGHRARRDRRAAVGGGVRPRRDRLADRPARGDHDRAAPRRAAERDGGHRGREPRQRRHGARRLPGGRRRGGRQLRPARRDGRLRRQRGRRDRVRRRLRARARPGLQEDRRRRRRRRRALAGVRLHRLPAGGGARRLGRARRRRGRPDRRAALARALDRRLAAARLRVLGGARLPAQRDAVRARGAAAAVDPGRSGALRGRARSASACS